MGIKLKIVMDTISLVDESGSNLPKYKRVAQAMRQQIADGVLVPGQKVPTVRDLAWELKITPGTVARAYALLTQDGVLEAGVGRGTFVADRRQPGVVAEDQPKIVSLYSPMLPDAGQGALLRRAMEKAAHSLNRGDLMSYPDPDADGRLSAALQSCLRDQLGAYLPADRIIPTYGGQAAIHLALSCIVSGDRPVILQDRYTYPGFRRAAELVRAEVVPVDMDDEGPLPDQLEAAARKKGAQVFCTTPDAHNPTTRSISARRRSEIAAVLNRTGLQILEDECFATPNGSADGFRTLVPGLAWSVTSISKILTPALRLGALVPPAAQVEWARRLSTGSNMGLSRPWSEMCIAFLTDPEIPSVRAHVNDLCEDYLRVAVNHLGAYDISLKPGLPFIWLRLPDRWRVPQVIAQAAARGVRLKATDDFALRGDVVPNALRISINCSVSKSCFEDTVLCLRDILGGAPDRFSA